MADHTFSPGMSGAWGGVVKVALSIGLVDDQRGLSAREPEPHLWLVAPPTASRARVRDSRGTGDVASRPALDAVDATRVASNPQRNSRISECSFHSGSSIPRRALTANSEGYGPSVQPCMNLRAWASWSAPDGTLGSRIVPRVLSGPSG